MDINQLYTAPDHEKGAEMQVKDQFGNPLDCFITLVGIDSKAWRKIDAESNRQMLAMLAEGKVEDRSAESLAKAATGWRGFTDKGEEIPFSVERVTRLFKDAPYIKDQADRFIAARVNFTKG